MNDYYRDYNNARFDLENQIDKDLKGFAEAYIEENLLTGEKTFYQCTCTDEQLNYLFFIREKINKEIVKARKVQKNAQRRVILENK